MRDVFYSVLNAISFKTKYYEAYKAKVEFIMTGFSIVCALASAGSIYAWTRYADLQILWSLILFAAQVAQILKTYLPYSRRLDALKYLIPDMEQLVIEVENKWYEMELTEDPDYIPVVLDYRRRLVELEVKYLGADTLPDLPCLRSKAEKELKSHFALYTEIMGGGEEDAAAPSNQPKSDPD